MSVPVNQRTHGKLEACVKTLAVATYTLKITSNPKIFVPEFQRSLTDRIVETAVGIHVNAWTANNIMVDSPEALAERTGLQMKAITGCTLLMALIDIARPVFHLETRRVQYWGMMCLDAKALLRSWRNSDIERFSRYNRT